MKPTTSKDKSVTTNPMEFALVHRNQTFALSRSFSRTDISEGEEPLALYNGKSRITATLIGSNGTYVEGNIEPWDMSAIIAKSNFAINKDWENMYFGGEQSIKPDKETDEKTDTKETDEKTDGESDKETDEKANKKAKEEMDKEADEEADKESNESNETKPDFTSPAYTVQIKNGKFKGMTPAEVLLQNPTNKAELNSHYLWLKKNLKQYPKNREIMNALEDACRLSNEHKLVAMNNEDTDNEDSKANPKKKAVCIPIYSNLKANIWRKRDDGMCFTYSITINYYMGLKSPVSIKITNYYAPYVQSSKGLVNAQPKMRDQNTYKYVTMDLSIEEWLEVLHDTETAMRLFENQVGPACIRDAERIAKEKALEAQRKREEAQRAQQGMQQVV